MTATGLPEKGLKIIHFASSLWTLFLRHCAAVWGKVGEVQPPHLVLPITIEPSKPRLCIDAHTPFSLDKLIDVPRFVYKNSFMSKIDEKSGYDHILLTKESSKYFGIEWKGLWCPVCTTLPFGWKNSPYVYQTIGLVATDFFRQKGIACSLYIDDRFNGELFTWKGFWPRPIGQRDTGYSYKSATLQAFLIPEKKKEKFASPREGILIHKSSIPLKSLQRLMGNGAGGWKGHLQKGKSSQRRNFVRKWNFGDYLMNGTGTSLGKMRNTGFCQPRRMLRCHAGLASFIVNLMTWYLGTSGDQI